MRIEYGGIAQLGERLNGIQEVSGSIPLISTKSPENHWFSGLFLLVFSLFACFLCVLGTREKTGFLFFVHAVIMP